jgi:hypothetical protein
VGTAAAAPAGGAAPKSRSTRAPTGGPPRGIAARRRRLRANGAALESTTTHAAAEPLALGARERARVAVELSTRGRLRSAGARLHSFEVVAAPAAPAGPGERFHVLLHRSRTGLSAVVAREEDRQVQQVVVLHER